MVDYRWIRTFAACVVPHSDKFESCTRPEFNDRSRKSFISALEQCELSSLIENRGCGLLLRNMLLRVQQMSCMNIYMNYEWLWIRATLPFLLFTVSDFGILPVHFIGVNRSGNKLKNLTSLSEYNRFWLFTKNLNWYLSVVHLTTKTLNVANKWTIINFPVLW
jgi:hypothetical protein